MNHCTGNCDQGRKPCDCPLDADHGDYVSPTVRFIQNLILLAVFVIAVIGVINLLTQQGVL